MSFLRNRGIAAAITVLAVIAATVFGVHRTVSRMTRDIERTFYEGFYNDQGFREPSIYSQMNRVVNSALALATVMQNYPELEGLADNVIQARRFFIDAGSITDKSSTFDNLQQALSRLESAMRNAQLTERDAEVAEQYMQTISGAANLIERLSWEYNEIISSGPDGLSPIAGLINTFIPARSPDLLP